MPMFSATALGDAPEALQLLSDLRAPTLRADIAERWDAAVAAGVDVARPCGSVSIQTGGRQQPQRVAPLLALLRRPEAHQSAGALAERAQNASPRADADAEADRPICAGQKTQAVAGSQARAAWVAAVEHAIAGAALGDFWRAKTSWTELIRADAPTLAPLLSEAAKTPSLWADPFGDSPWNALASLDSAIRRSLKTPGEHAALHAALLIAQAPAALGQNPLFALIREASDLRNDKIDVDFALARAIFDSQLSFHHGAKRSALWVLNEVRASSIGLSQQTQRAERMDETLRLVEADVLRHETEKAKAAIAARDPQGATGAKPRRVSRI